MPSGSSGGSPGALLGFPSVPAVGATTLLCGLEDGAPSRLADWARERVVTRIFACLHELVPGSTSNTGTSVSNVVLSSPGVCIRDIASGTLFTPPGM